MEICTRELDAPRAVVYALCMPTTLARNIAAMREHLGLKQEPFAKRIGVPQSYISKWERQGKVPETASLEKLAELAGVSTRSFRDDEWSPPDDRGPLVRRRKEASITTSSGEIEMVGIRFSDAAFGLGATFADEPASIEVLQFPKAWVESITFTSPALLSWVRARGSSMKPTINDGDMILLDHSQRKVEDQDDIWAFTVGDTRAIKRLRVKGDRYQIFSDNPAVDPDEEPIDFVNIVGRVILVGSRT